MIPTVRPTELIVQALARLALLALALLALAPAPPAQGPAGHLAAGAPSGAFATVLERLARE